MRHVGLPSDHVDRLRYSLISQRESTAVVGCFTVTPKHYESVFNGWIDDPLDGNFWRYLRFATGHTLLCFLEVTLEVGFARLKLIVGPV